MNSSPNLSRRFTASRILIADDSEPNLNYLNDFLSAHGYTTCMARNGAEAVERLKEFDPHLMLLDIMMPEMDGFEVLEYLKNWDMIYQFPVIVVSAMDDMDSIIRCIQCGATDYLVKPFNAILLKAKIENSLEKKFWQEHERLIFDNLASSHEAMKLLNEARNDLANIIVHDLSNPLSTIKGYTQFLSMKNRQKPITTADLDKNIKKISQAISDMEILIRGILDVGKLESNKMRIHLSTFDIVHMIHDIYENYQLQKGKSRRFEYDSFSESLEISADQHLLVRVIQNLLNNAFKHTPQDASIGIFIKGDSDRVIISIEDSGYGIPEGIKERIFDKFVQVEGRKIGKKYGVGLGLYFCKMAVEAMGGNIRCISEVDRGTSFFVELPIKSTLANSETVR